MSEEFNSSSQGGAPATPPENAKNMKQCKSCGASIAKSAKACPTCGAKNKKPIFKKVWFWLIIAVVLIFVIASAGSGGDDKKAGGETTKPGVVSGEVTEDNQLGKYSVEISGVRKTEDYEGKPAIVVTYKYTNNTNDTPTSFIVAFDDEVYQDGVGLNEAIFLKDGDPYSSDNQSKEIKKGASIDVEVAYTLNDDTTDIDVEVKELFSFSDKVVSRTFSLK